MELLYVDADIVVCLKPARVLSTDEPGGLPELLRAELGTKDFRTVHRLDRVARLWPDQPLQESPQ